MITQRPEIESPGVDGKVLAEELVRKAQRLADFVQVTLCVTCFLVGLILYLVQGGHLMAETTADWPFLRSVCYGAALISWFILLTTISRPFRSWLDDLRWKFAGIKESVIGLSLLGFGLLGQIGWSMLFFGQAWGVLEALLQLLAFSVLFSGVFFIARPIWRWLAEVNSVVDLVLFLVLLGYAAVAYAVAISTPVLAMAESEPVHSFMLIHVRIPLVLFGLLSLEPVTFFSENLPWKRASARLEWACEGKGSLILRELTITNYRGFLNGLVGLRVFSKSEQFAWIDRLGESGVVQGLQDRDLVYKFDLAGCLLDTPTPLDSFELGLLRSLVGWFEELTELNPSSVSRETLQRLGFPFDIIQDLQLRLECEDSPQEQVERVRFSDEPLCGNSEVKARRWFQQIPSPQSC